MLHPAEPREDRNMLGLAGGEQFVVWGLRRIITQRHPDTLLLDECRAAFGCDGEAGFHIFRLFLHLLGRAARKPYEIAPTSTLVVMQDELRILALLAAAQHGEETDDHGLLEAHLLWLAVPLHRPALTWITLAFARLLAAHGHQIAATRRRNAAGGNAFAGFSAPSVPPMPRAVPAA